MPGGGHNSHPVIFDSEGRMYVGIGSNGNVDQNSNQARIVRFTIAGLLPLPYSSGEVDKNLLVPNILMNRIS